MNIFYTYRHIRLDSNTPFYVGKGKDKRAWSKSGRNRYWHNIVNKVGYRIEFISSELTEKEAFASEFYSIGAYRACGFCEANLTDGGEGLTFSEEHRKKISDSLRGHILSDETRKKMSKSLKGKVISKEHRQKLSESGKGKRLKSIICYDNLGYYKKFKSLKGCALELNFKGVSGISCVLTKKRKTHHGYRFKYA